MHVNVNWSVEVVERFPPLSISIGTINGVQNIRRNEEVEALKKTVYDEARAKHRIETLRDDPVIRAYRDFYWRLDIDPTKTRPAGEALLRRVLHGDQLPSISATVDAYNLASLKTKIPISGFDQSRVMPPLQVRFAKNHEPFEGIGMDKTIFLTEKTLVLADEKRVLCIYPYRDSDDTKINLQTRDVMIIGYGVPGVGQEQLREAVKMTMSYVRRVSGGQIETVRVFSSGSQ